MAKKRAKSVKKAKRSVNKTVEAAPVIPVKKSNGGVIMAVVVLVIVALISIESLMMIKQSAMMNKKPALVTSYKSFYRGIVCGVVYNNDYITVGIDNNQVQVQDKMTGQLKGFYTPVGASLLWAAESKDGTIYCMLKGTSTLFKIKDFKKIGEVVLPEVKVMSGFCINSKDELVAGDNTSAKIYRYSLDGVKLGEMAGFGSGNDKIQGGIGRVFTDAKDNIYVFTGNPCAVKVLTASGRFITDIAFPKQDVCSMAQVAVAADGNIYINDFSGSKIIVFSPGGKMIGKFDRDISGNFQITFPPAISGGSDGNIYVCTHEIAVFKTIKY